MSEFTKQCHLDWLLEEIEKCDNNPPDDEWDSHHQRGFRSGLIKALEIVSGESLNYNMTLSEIQDIVGG